MVAHKNTLIDGETPEIKEEDAEPDGNQETALKSALKEGRSADASTQQRKVKFTGSAKIDDDHEGDWKDQ